MEVKKQNLTEEIYNCILKYLKKQVVRLEFKNGAESVTAIAEPYNYISRL